MAFTFQQVIFHPFYVDVSGCPRVVPDNDLLFECFPEFKEVSRFPVYIIVFLVVPALIFAIIKGIYFLAHLFKKHAE